MVSLYRLINVVRSCSGESVAQITGSLDRKQVTGVFVADVPLRCSWGTDTEHLVRCFFVWVGFVSSAQWVCNNSDVPVSQQTGSCNTKNRIIYYLFSFFKSVLEGLNSVWCFLWKYSYSWLWGMMGNGSRSVKSVFSADEQDFQSECVSIIRLCDCRCFVSMWHILFF